MAATLALLWALLLAAAASPLPQDVQLVQGDVQVVQDVPIPDNEEILQASVIIRPPKIEKVTQVTSNNQYQKLYDESGKYKFGFDDENQFRVEERLSDGQLRGIYGYKNDDGSYSAFMYTYDGESYKQVPYTVQDIPEQLRLPVEAQAPARFVRNGLEAIAAEPAAADLESEVIEAAP
ncbi:uncharacterized protein LOC122379844 [Amphibalanus amphitrite]|uniref:uncharacterized protein LOC122379844 n=1 Tax=Amphibalanus amphitrite TaxID=1232801 RepID=UPI001C9027AA|nr:uncharacterized protein LOC122379844 [Amphibalanus amphitrite]